MNSPRATSRHTPVLPPRGNLRPCVMNAASTQAGRLLSPKPPQNIGGDCIQTHEADASVPRLSAQAGATFNSIPLAGCPAPLPPIHLERNHVSHALSPSVGVSQTQHSQERVHGDGKAFRSYGKEDDR